MFNLTTNHPCSCGGPALDTPECPDEIEPTASDYIDARDELAANAELLGEFLAEDDHAYEFAVLLFEVSDRFRDRALVRYEGWLHNKARELAEKRAQDEYEQSLQDEADARSEW